MYTCATSWKLSSSDVNGPPRGIASVQSKKFPPTSFVHVMQSSAQLWWCVPLCLPGNDVGTGKRAPEPCPRPPPSSPWRRRGGQWPANLISYFIIPFVQFSAKANLPFYNTLSMLDLNWSLMQTALCLWNWGRVLWCWLRRVMMMMMTNSDDDDDDGDLWWWRWWWRPWWWWWCWWHPLMSFFVLFVTTRHVGANIKQQQTNAPQNALYCDNLRQVFYFA